MSVVGTELREVIAEALLSAGVPPLAVAAMDALEVYVGAFVGGKLAAYDRALQTGQEMMERHQRECAEWIATHKVKP